MVPGTLNVCCFFLNCTSSSSSSSSLSATTLIELNCVCVTFPNRSPPYYRYHALVNVRDRIYGTSLLHAAARSGNYSCVRLLLDTKVCLAIVVACMYVCEALHSEMEPLRPHCSSYKEQGFHFQMQRLMYACLNLIQASFLSLTQLDLCRLTLKRWTSSASHRFMLHAHLAMRVHWSLYRFESVARA